MGADFLERAAPTFKKSWDRSRVSLATPDFFTKTPNAAPRSATADVEGNTPLCVGDNLTVEAREGRLVALRGNREVARFSNPANELLDAVSASFGVARGKVEQVYPIAGVVEISLC